MKTKPTMNTKFKYTESEKYQKHFTLDDRVTIQKIITANRTDQGKFSFILKDMGDIIQKDPSSISKEVKLNRVFKKRSTDNRLGSYNAICSTYRECKKKMDDFYNYRTYCKNFIKCVDSCEEYKEYICPALKKFPWVCNGCPNANGCHLNKYYYFSDIAQKNYESKLTSSRKGINLSADDFNLLNHTVSEYVYRKQPIFHILKSNDLPVSERTIYNYFEKGYFSACSVDLRRQVTYKKRYSHKDNKIILKKIKVGRQYEDYQEYVLDHPDASIVEMDTMISTVGSSKVLLTLHFVKFHFQLAFLLPNKEACNVTAVFNNLCLTLGLDAFKSLFEVILTDNGTEFSDPLSIEYEPNTGELRSHIFFCHPYRSGEKGHCEKNHEYIRYFLPKGTSFEFLNQTKVNIMMSHINSTIRPSVKCCPYDYMALTYGTELLDKLEIKRIDFKLVSLSKKTLNQ